LVHDDAGTPIVEIFTNDETGHASARCLDCPWTENHRGRLDDTVQAAEIHADLEHPAGS
jgi:hypothetical protein